MAKAFKHNDMRTWELAVDAIRQLGGHAKASEVRSYIDRHTTDYNPSNLHVDLGFASVNCHSRVNHSPNKKPRRTDSGIKHDALYKEGIGREAVYHIYDPTKHGIWEIALDPNKSNGLFIRPLQDFLPELSEAQNKLEVTGAFDPSNISDARQRIASSVVARRGQQAFRQALFSAYGGRCAITRCEVAGVLEAAHIFPYRGPNTNHVSNGILLRADMHTLFDIGLLRISPTDFRVELGSEIEESEYAQLNGMILHLPLMIADQPSREALEAKYNFSV